MAGWIWPTDRNLLTPDLDDGEESSQGTSSTQMQKTGVQIGAGQKVTICKPGREHSPDTELAGILILDFSASRTVRNKLFKPPNLWYFVMAALAD